MNKPQKYLSHTDPDDENIEIIDSYINEDYKEQYAYEGYIFSGLVTAIGLCFLVILYLPKFIHNRLLLDIIVFAFLAAVYQGHT